MDRTLFIPIKGVEVRAEIETNATFTSLEPECYQCAQTFKKSGILDVLVSVNWRLLDCFNLKTIVSCNIFLNL